MGSPLVTATPSLTALLTATPEEAVAILKANDSRFMGEPYEYTTRTNMSGHESRHTARNPTSARMKSNELTALKEYFLRRPHDHAHILYPIAGSFNDFSIDVLAFESFAPGVHEVNELFTFETSQIAPRVHPAAHFAFLEPAFTSPRNLELLALAKMKHPGTYADYEY